MSSFNFFLKFLLQLFKVKNHVQGMSASKVYIYIYFNILLIEKNLNIN